MSLPADVAPGVHPHGVNPSVDQTFVMLFHAPFVRVEYVAPKDKVEKERIAMKPKNSFFAVVMAINFS